MKPFLRNMIIAAALLMGGGALYAQNSSTYPQIPTLLGNELVQIQSRTNNTAAITYTTTANLREARYGINDQNRTDLRPARSRPARS